jgi:uncharacterized protein YodC (DUF2158 family)
MATISRKLSLGSDAICRAAEPSAPAAPEREPRTMLMLMKKSLIAVVLGFALSAPWTDPGAADATLSNAPMGRHASLQTGDLVRLRSGGPLMTVQSIQGDHVICSWSEANGEIRSDTFPVAMVMAPVTPAPNEGDLQKDERESDQYYQEHCPSGTLSFSGKFRCSY